MIRKARRLLLAACLLAVSSAADHKLENGVAAPDGIPAALKERIQAQGVRVLDDSGAPYAEIWLHKALSAQAKAAGPEVVYTGIPEGSFLGVWRFVGAGSDFRGQPIKPGFYSMRYALMPSDGNHIGESQYRDFVLLTPADLDQKPDTNLNFDETVALSRKASGKSHPAVFPLQVPESVTAPTLVKNDSGHWILKATVSTKSGGALPLAVTVVGRAEQ